MKSEPLIKTATLADLRQLEHKRNRPRQGRERAGIIGRITAVMTDIKTGKFCKQEIRNTIVRTGLARLIRAPFSSQLFVTKCAVGDGLTAPATTDTTLTSEVDVKAFTTTSDAGVTGDNPTMLLRTLFDTDEAIGNIREVGMKYSDDVLFNHALMGSGVITGATQANPCVITDVAHGLTDTSIPPRIVIEAVGGMTQLNGNTYFVDVLTVDTFALYSDEGLTTAINSTGFGAYTSGGTWKLSYEKTASRNLQIDVNIGAANA